MSKSRYRKPPEAQKDYVAQIQGMIHNRNAWRAAHPGADVRIQFNYPPKVMMICTVPEALSQHYISANADGLELLKALWPWGGRDEPTALMARIAIEAPI